MNASATTCFRVAYRPLLMLKEKRTFSLKKKFTATPRAEGRTLGQESKRNKWREARREVPFMPDCDLEPESDLLLPTRHAAGISRAKPLASITLLSIFLPIDTFFRKMIVRGVERPIVAAKH